jgi:hypothetical protein
MNVGYEIPPVLLSAGESLCSKDNKLNIGAAAGIIFVRMAAKYSILLINRGLCLEN